MIILTTQRYNNSKQNSFICNFCKYFFYQVISSRNSKPDKVTCKSSATTCRSFDLVLRTRYQVWQSSLNDNQFLVVAYANPV